MSISMDEWSTLVEDCENREQRLSDWERQFIDSIRRQLDAGRPLTTKQADTLSNIWDKIT